MPIILLLTVYAGFALSAQAQTGGTVRESECHHQDDPSLRLACYDRLTQRKELKAKIKTENLTDKSGREATRLNLTAVCDVKKLFEDVSRITPKKDDFQTEAIHEANVRAELQKAGIKSSQIFCEAAPHKRLKYNAEKRSINVFLLGNNYAAPEVNLGSYEGKNAYGTVINVRKSSQETWELDSLYSLSEIDIPIAPEKAKEQFDALEVGVFGELVKPFVSIDDHASTPTFSMPYEQRYITHKIHFKPTSYVMYNAKTRDILWQSTVSTCNEGYRPELKLGKC
ncbi:hypothetical protein [Methylobacterium nigriterrae]|uniref:hypothetical protein n=1 Tax=Methylobacterium nigriterrae TaxID=3127512 RepID=UPI0030140353